MEGINHESESISDAFGWTEEQVAKQMVVYIEVAKNIVTGEHYPHSKAIEDIAKSDLTEMEKIHVAFQVERATAKFRSLVKQALE